MNRSNLGRRRFLQGLGATAVAAATPLAGAEPAVKRARSVRRSASDRPNVLVVMSDQHRADFMGCAGHAVLRTPGWDRLAREGTRLAAAYCGYPLCCPSRMSFLAGRLPSAISCNDNVAQLGSDVPTVAHGFAAAGYETVLAGRMHIIGFDQRHGFSRRLMPDIPGTAFFNAGSWGPRILGSLAPATGATRQSLLSSGPGQMSFHDYDQEVASRTIRWLERRGRAGAGGRAPFFLVAGLIVPHPPFVAQPDDFRALRDQFLHADLPKPRLETLHPLHRAVHEHKEYADPSVTPDARLRTLVAYAANCIFVDRQVQRLLAALDELKLARDTIVVYTSDHGEQMGAHGLWGKNVFYDESMRVPMIVRWPGEVEAGRIISECVSLVDLGSTLLDLAGLEPLPRALSPGFGRWLRSAAAPRDEAPPVIIEGVFGGDVPARTVRQGRWRYSCYHGHGEELYDLQEDPGEFRNLAPDPTHGEVRSKLARVAAAGWEPEEILTAVRARRRELPLIRAWIDSSELTEPDDPWHSGRSLANWVEP